MQFEHFVTFTSGVGYPRATGYFIREQVANERYRRGDTHEHPSPFLLRHNTNANILDEDLVYQLLDIIAQHAEAEVKWDRLKTEKAVQGRVKPAAETVTLLPVAVRIDTRLGRWYLLGMRGEMPTMVRLGSIHAVKRANRSPRRSGNTRYRRLPTRSRTPAARAASPTEIQPRSVPNCISIVLPVCAPSLNARYGRDRSSNRTGRNTTALMSTIRVNWCRFCAPLRRGCAFCPENTIWTVGFRPS